MEQRYLIDTNTVIYYLEGSLPEPGMHFMNTLVDATPNFSVITKIELLRFEPFDKADELLLNDFVSSSLIMEMSEAVITQTIQLAKCIRK